MRRFVNHYEVLGVDRDAGNVEIKRAYRKLAARFHPDRVGHLPREERESAEEEMRKINNAKAVLLDMYERCRLDHIMGVMERRNVPTSTEFSDDVEVTIVTDEMDGDDGPGPRGRGRWEEGDAAVVVVEEVEGLDDDGDMDGGAGSGSGGPSRAAGGPMVEWEEAPAGVAAGGGGDRPFRGRDAPAVVEKMAGVRPPAGPVGGHIPVGKKLDGAPRRVRIKITKRP